MGTGRKYNKKPHTRPRKSGGVRRRRDELHKKRLIALGMSEAKIKHLTSKAIRTLIKTPVQTAAKLAKLAKLENA